MELLDITQAAAMLNIPVKSVYIYAKRKQIPGMRVGRHWRFVREDLEQWIKESCTVRRRNP